eukprot:CAMPEP_0202914948 /NCGR_PEP_ID=MMETSP1392-20130828/64509_1 /ASSEMBLY_ACC=CAM_ASM_000868 /TAXON_ID=225041 /ORGANISM="Chlamydomonas chlamydogama, Strain SAG 11-48b" /LENGTH=83 /DNA_ID=CAMNT_0049606801 /DNA_START=1 /DNA_END=249 /DNA_ORIENTATION=+
MSDTTRAVERVRMQVSTRPRRLGQPDSSRADPSSGAENGTAAAADDADTARDPETFDDGEFYQQLLREFLARAGSAGEGAGAA